MSSQSNRVLIALLAALLCVTTVGGVQAPLDRTLSFEDRVAAQRAIEEVYWQHRIWPKENPGPKPALDTLLPDARSEAPAPAGTEAERRLVLPRSHQLAGLSGAQEVTK